jgi:FkbM family methyltransferase
MFTALKRLVKNLFSVFGLEIRKNKQQESAARGSMTGVLRQLTTLGLRPQTVIDVGVAFQTAELYEEFAEADILLIEPVAEFEPFLRKICDSYHAQYILAAAGECPGTATLNVHPDRFGSSLLKEVEGTSVDGVPRQVPVITIDQACAERSFNGPYLIKVDVQGAELQVLAGARQTLLETEAVILELNLFATMIGGPQFYDVVSQMKTYGFVVYDIYGFTYRPFDGALAQVDMVFVRDQGHLRSSHVFSTPEKRQQQFSDAKVGFAAQRDKYL